VPRIAEAVTEVQRERAEALAQASSADAVGEGATAKAC